MTTPDAEREAAARLPDGDVVGLLLEQHARIRELFAEITHATGEHRQRSFDALRALLAVHEAAEELIVRPVAERTAGESEAHARSAEEEEASRVLKTLEGMDVSSPEFLDALVDFERAVGQHADREEMEEFPALLADCTTAQRHTMGQRMLRAEHLVPTHPHPGAMGSRTALAMTGPFMAMMDKARDAMGR